LGVAQAFDHAERGLFLFANVYSHLRETTGFAVGFAVMWRIIALLPEQAYEIGLLTAISFLAI